MPAPKTVNCPRCGIPVEWTPEHRYRPFCSERCKLIDLGAWATGRYGLPVARPDDEGVDPDSTDE